MTPLDLPDDATITLEQRPLLVNDGEGLGVEQPWTRAEMSLGLALDEIRGERAPTIWRVYPDYTGRRASLYTCAEGEAVRLDHAMWMQPGRTVDWLLAWETCQNSLWMIEGLSELDPTLAAIAVLQIARMVYQNEAVTRIILELRECLHTKTMPERPGGERSRGRQAEWVDLIRSVVLPRLRDLRGGTQGVMEREARNNLRVEAARLVRFHCERDGVPIEARVNESPFWLERLAAHADTIRTVVSPDSVFTRLRRRELDRAALRRERDEHRARKQKWRKRY